MRLTKIFIAIFAPDERLPSSATLIYFNPSWRAVCVQDIHGARRFPSSGLGSRGYILWSQQNLASTTSGVFMESIYISLFQSIVTSQHKTHWSFVSHHLLGNIVLLYCNIIQEVSSDKTSMLSFSQRETCHLGVGVEWEGTYISSKSPKSPQQDGIYITWGPTTELPSSCFTSHSLCEL